MSTSQNQDTEQKVFELDLEDQFDPWFSHMHHCSNCGRILDNYFDWDFKDREKALDYFEELYADGRQFCVKECMVKFHQEQEIEWQEEAEWHNDSDALDW